MTINRVTLNDLYHITELFDLYRLFQKQESDQEGAKAFLTQRLTNEESVIFMAFDGEEPVGFVQLYPLFSSVRMQKTWLLNDLYIKENARNKGFGKQLIQTVIDFAKETGAKGISLETCDDNFGAQRLYEKIGFIKESNYFYSLSV